jgi:phosphoribosylformylglycinamidine synthase
MRVRERLHSPLRAAAARGVPMIGACNGFQVMVQVGLLPGPEAGEPWPQEPPTPTAGLAFNDSFRFIDRWPAVAVEPGTVCLWTADLDPEAGPDVLRLPIAHGEGRLVLADPGDERRLAASGRVALRYAEPVNGSAGSIAGLCDASGRILGLMPHPERYLDWTRHPYWTRLDRGVRRGHTPGLAMFRSAVRAAQALGV